MTVGVATLSGRGYTPGAMAIRPELRAELLTLPANEREELADLRYESLDDEARDPDWEQAWRQEIERRIADVTSGRVELVDADLFHEALRSELHALRR